MSTIYRPTKRIYLPNDPFFEEGNIALRAYWLKKEAYNEHEIEMIQQEAAAALSQSKSIHCDPCRLEFSNITAYEYHYESRHANVCSICQKIFPGAEWLRLHLDELHNVLLKLQKERGGKIHKCYVETCSKYFSTPKMRRLHLIDKHKYPKHFPFDLVFTGTLTFEQLKKRDEKNKRRLKQREAIEMDVDKKPKRKNSSKQDPMDALAQEFNQKLKIPQTISFGRPTKPTLRKRQRKKKKDSAMDIE